MGCAMTVPLSYLDAPRRMLETWDWTCALVAFDYGDRAPLAELVGKEPNPPRMALLNFKWVAGHEG